METASVSRRRRVSLVTAIAAGSLWLGTYACAEPLPAQPVTDLMVPTKKDPRVDSSPFNIVQVEEKLFFFAYTRRGPNLFARDIQNIEIEPGVPAVDMTGKKKFRPKLVKPFKKDQAFDDQVVTSYTEGVGSTKAATLGALYFHMPGKGLIISRGTRGSTKVLKATDTKRQPSEWLTGLTAIRQVNSTPYHLLFGAFDKKLGYEVFASRVANDRSPIHIFAGKNTKVLADLNPSGDSNPFGFVQSDEHIYFAARSQVTGVTEIFHTKGFAAPTPISENLGMVGTIASDGALGALFAGPSTVDGETDLWWATPTSVEKLTQNGSSPTHMTPFGGSASLFSVRTTNNLGRELAKVVLGPGTPSFTLFEINPGPGSSDPDQFLGVGGLTYLTAFDGTSRRLFRCDGFDLEEIKADDGAVLTVDETHEKVVVFNTLYFTAKKEGQADPWLWKINNNAVSTNAVRVNTAAGFPVANARELAAYGKIGTIFRLYFSCDGVGTEFNNPDHEDKRFHPRGRELWVTSEM